MAANPLTIRRAALNPQIFQGYRALIAQPNEAEDVYGFYAQKGRPDAVYLRDKSLIEDRVRNGHFIVVKNSQEKIIAAATIYSLNDGKKMNWAINEGSSLPERGSVVELGSVLKGQDLPNANGIRPRWIWHAVLFGLPMMNAFYRATENDQPFDAMVCTVKSGKVQNINRLTGDSSVIQFTPLRWTRINPTSDVIQAFRATTDDPNANNSKEFFSPSIQNLPLVAQYFTRASQESTQHRKIPEVRWNDCILHNHKGDLLHIDLSGLPAGLLNAMEVIAEHPNALARMPRNLSWAEGRRLVAPLLEDQPADPHGLLQQRYNDIRQQAAGRVSSSRKSAPIGNGARHLSRA